MEIKEDYKDFSQGLTPLGLRLPKTIANTNNTRYLKILGAQRL